MLNYVKSEFYRIFRERSIWVLSAVFSALVIAACIVLFLTNKATPNFPYANTRYLLSTIASMMVIPFFMLSTIPQTVVGEEIREKTLKNSVSFGVSRSTIYFGKWFVNVVGLLIVGVITVSISMMGSYLFLEDSGITFTTDFIMALIGMFPLLLAGLTTYHFLYFWSPNTNYVFLCYGGVYLLPFLIGYFLGGKFETIRWLFYHCVVYLMSNSYLKGRHVYMAGNTTNGMITCYLVGIGLTVIFLIIGYVHFKRNEIK
ncbi:ABC transporter permease subunit [Anaeromicropila herbilytica]|uniref:ABC transporter permease n=1 Tax=Anaeromicropila herbilytica TaxID=2785025 RepID=A0A7R7EK37_9FIRM|nr:ABC transporter permease subunit [Anaeromicropila herbilytica]BCN30219.1 ABC transporter permease [Anaeromicropila herbilytica]